MSNLGSRPPQMSRSREAKIVIDLNAPPPADNPYQAGGSANAGPEAERSHPLVVSLPAAPIDVDAYDDDVVLLSARAFAQAKNYSRRRQRRVVVVDVDSEGSSSRQSRNNRRGVVPDESSTNCINLEGSGSSKTSSPPPEPSFACPICMGPFVEEMSTKCGHIFCQACIMTSIATLPSCPTCRTKITIMDIFRIFLPTTN